MAVNRFLNSFRFLKKRSDCETEKTAENWAEIRCNQRDWEDYYRRRWQYDKKIRSTHGVNCTGSCSWNVYVKDGIVVWETQKTDYPSGGPDWPDHEPRGCPRGATYSWYIYSPLRVKYPYIKSSLLEMWRESLQAQVGSGENTSRAEGVEPVAAWATIMEDTEKRKRYQKDRGKGGLVRTSWEEVRTIIAASLVYTIKKYGPDRIVGFTPIPAMSMVGYASGARFISLIGGSMLSFYDWYSDLPPASPQIWGEQTDVPESADWFEASYIIAWGSNIPQTRTPDAHFFTEARYRGAKITSVAPDYAEYVKFADTWLPAKAGTDSALAMAMTHVVLKEFYIERQSDYFTSYVKQFTDLPFLVKLEKTKESYSAGKFLKASDMGLDIENAEWKPAYFDSNSSSAVIPNGGIGFRWDESGKWNLKQEDSTTGEGADPLLSLDQIAEDWLPVQFPFFNLQSSELRTGMVPVKRVRFGNEEIIVTTVFDLMVANLGIDRGHGGDIASDYNDPAPYSPAWQEAITGVNRQDAIRVAREFAENAEKTKGKSMIILGSGVNHWFHSDMIYRSILNLTTLCGCQGKNGGGWAHYTGQEKIRPMAGWATLAFGLDWIKRPRRQNGTAFYYFAADQWRYERIDLKSLVSPLADTDIKRHPADFNAIAVRLGWVASYPQFNKNPLELCGEAEKAGASADSEILDHVVSRIKSGDLEFSVQDVDNPVNFPRNLFFWRANVLGSSGKGHEYFLKHLLGADSSVLGEETDLRTDEIVWREPIPEGKLDLLVTMDFRMSTSALYSDIVLPAASWYEMHDLNTTDMHPFIHPFTPAVDPPWEAKTDWEHFRGIAEKFSELAEHHLGEKRDVVATPLFHDSPGELGQAVVKDWKKGAVEPIPGKTMPNLTIIKRDYRNIHNMMISLGPNVEHGAIGAKGIFWKSRKEYDELADILGTLNTPGLGNGRPLLSDSRRVAEAILALAPETNGAVAVRAWGDVEQKTGLKLKHLSQSREGEKFTFDDVVSQPRKVITSPIWSGIEAEGRRYSANAVNIEEKVPFRTLTGRAHFYLDHEWMFMFGESLPVYRPPLHLTAAEQADIKKTSAKELVLNYLTPHSKWSIHSTYADTLIMLTLFRGGKVIWINNDDAAEIEVADNDWMECFNANGLVLARAVVSHRIPRGKAMMYHALERTIDTPGSPLTNSTGGMHNSVTRTLMKPTHMIGGYSQLSYDFNYYGPTGNQRDTLIVVRKAAEVIWYEN